MTVKSGSRRRGRRPAQPEPDSGPTADAPTDAGKDQPVQDWSDIAVGSTVNVTPPVGLPYLGRVDAKTPDSAIVWVVSLAGSGRQMHGNRDGVSLLPAALQAAAVQPATVQSAAVQPAAPPPAAVQPAAPPPAAVQQGLLHPEPLLPEPRQPASLQPASLQDANLQPATRPQANLHPATRWPL